MRKLIITGARANIGILRRAKVNEDLLFALLTGISCAGRIGSLDMDVMLASRRREYSGHNMLAEKRLPSQSTSIQSPFQFRMIGGWARSWRMGGVKDLLEG